MNKQRAHRQIDDGLFACVQVLRQRYSQTVRHQVIVTFTNRPDVELALLTSYLQQQVKARKMEYDDRADLLRSVMKIANNGTC